VRFNSDSLHDLVGPVNQIGAMADLILKRYSGQLDDDAKTLLGFVQGSANRLQNLVAGLKTYMRVAGSLSPRRLCDAHALLAGAMASIQPQMEQSGAIVTHDPLPEVYCDPNQIGFVFASLLENSIKFRGDPPPEIHVSAAAEESACTFSVRDNGIGIDPRHGERIFGLFKRIHNDAQPGAGVGLAITRHIVERHGGRIWVDSQPACGATFRFTLPHDGLRSWGTTHENGALLS